MADSPLKVVRARKIVRGQMGSGATPELDLKISVYKDGLFNNKRKVVVTDSSGNKISGKDPIEYSTNGRYSEYKDIDFIRDYLDTQAKLQGGSSSVALNGKQVPVYQIIQDPWKERTPIIRDFGYDPYYFNNGVKAEILWFYRSRQVVGTQSDFDGGVEKRYKTTYVPDGGTEWCDASQSSLYDIERSEIIRGTYSEFGGAFIRDNVIKKFNITKTVKLTMPDNSVYGIGYIPESEQKLKVNSGYDDLAIVKYNDRKRYETIKDGDSSNLFEYSEIDWEDWQLLDRVRDLYSFQLERNKFITNRFDYKLELCKPDYDTCHLNGGIEFIDPITGQGKKEEEPPKKEEPNDTVAPTDNSKTNSSGTKIKMSVVLPSDFRVQANKDMPTIQVFAGEPPSGLNYREETTSGEEVLSDEYLENTVGLTIEEATMQDAASNGQQDSLIDSDYQSPPSSNSSNRTTVPEAKKIQLSVKEDYLYRQADSWARKLGKKPNVNYDNMRIGYKDGIHGLCPQGTMAMLAALTGVGDLGRIRGHADHFSFKVPGTGGGNSSFALTISGKQYYRDKIQIKQINGSWEGTYLDPKSKSKWQVGDIIAMGYVGTKPYGHIQIWTGFSWQSDFRQNDKIQQRNVNPDTVALWRMNDDGLALIQNNTGKDLA